MKKLFKNIQSQNSTKTIPADKILMSCGDTTTAENTMSKPWNVSGNPITNISRTANPPANPPATPAGNSIVIKSDLTDYLEKGGVTISGIYLRLKGGLVVGDINMSNHSITGLPSSYSGATIDPADMASVGIVNEDIGPIIKKVNDLIKRITDLDSGPDLDQLITDLGSPGTDGILANPEKAKWLVLDGKNSMLGPLDFQRIPASPPDVPDPTIKALGITGSTASGTTALGVISAATDPALLDRIVAVQDLKETLDAITKNTAATTNYPGWTGMDVPFICLKQSTGGSSTPNHIDSKSSEKYLTYVDESNVTLLRRGIYFVSFMYDFTQTATPPTTPTDVSCTISLTPNGSSGSSGTKTAYYTLTGKSDNTLIGQTYVLVEGDTASLSTKLSIEVTPNTSISKKSWTASFRACY
ncbi:hydrolase [Chlamydia vaughanii]|uniref:hydrolase n=1 Tax=Chlamydia vaughanii TaxID=3112552 RepID=UPI0032B1163D